jgi:hypothetical protein
MAQAWPALGTTIAIDEAYPPSGTYSLIGEVIKIGNAGGGEVGKRDTTNLSSTIKTYAPTIPDPGDLSITLNFDPTDSVHKFVRNLQGTPPTPPYVSNNFKITFNTGSTTSTSVVAGFVSGLDGPTADDVDGNLTADITIKMLGATTWVAAT